MHTHTQIDIYIHTCIDKYIYVYADARTHIWGISNTALNFCSLCGPKAMHCCTVGRSADIYIFIRELMQEKAGKHKRGGRRRRILSAEDREL